MRNRLWIAAIVFSFTMSSCNLPPAQPTGIPLSGLAATLETPTPSELTPTPVPVETLVDFELPTIAPTSTPSGRLASPRDQPVNCRFGPGTSYAIVGALLVGRRAEIIGRNADSTWWFVRNPSDPSTSCWLSAEFVVTEGDVGSLPVVTPLENMVTNVTVSVDPSVINVACDDLPQVVTISAQITSSGPSTVVWHWEVSDGFVSADKQVLFAAGDTKIVQDYYEVGVINDYIVRVQTTLPNIVTGQASFKVVCTP